MLGYVIEESDFLKQSPLTHKYVLSFELKQQVWCKQTVNKACIGFYVSAQVDPFYQTKPLGYDKYGKTM
jgi:hypothetical protein